MEESNLCCETCHLNSIEFYSESQTGSQKERQQEEIEQWNVVHSFCSILETAHNFMRSTKEIHWVMSATALLRPQHQSLSPNNEKSNSN